MLKRPELIRRAKKIRLLAMDVDGVLTDGAIIVLNSGEEVKFWNVKDRVGFFMLRRVPPIFRTAWITGRKSEQVAARAKEIGINALYQKCDDKGKALRETIKKFGLARDQTLFIGDDLVDLPAFKSAGLAICPKDAAEIVKKKCHFVTPSAGGRGVFRDVIELVLKSQGLLSGVIRRFENAD